MFFTRSLRAKTLLSVLIPTALGFVAVAIIALYAYERVARDVIQQRDRELASISAARLSESLSQYGQVLQNVAATDDIQSMEVLRLVSGLADAWSQLYVFDAGVVVYNSEGVALWSKPANPRRRAADFPLPAEFNRVRETMRPTFSNIFHEDISGEDVILIAVPIVDSTGEFKGVVAGLCTIKHSPIGDRYAEILEFQAGPGGHAYLVDGNGLIIYHRDSSQLGTYSADTMPVTRAIAGETGALLSEDATGQTVISGFAPVPGTDWALITRERWEDVVGPMRGYSNLLLGLLVAGVIGSGVLMFFTTGRVLRPIRDLTQGAQRIAAGDFEYNIAARTGDEVQALAEQFNAMASALKDSYRDLEQRVADRTKELAALNAIAAVASSSLDLQEILNDALAKTLEVTGIEAGGIYLLQEEASPGEDGVLTVAAYKGVSAQFVAEIDNLKVGEGLSGRVVQTGQPLVAWDLSTDPRLTRPVVRESGFRVVAIVPLASKQKVWGSMFVVTRGQRVFTEQDLQLLTSIGHQIGVAIENADLFDAEQRRAEQFRVISEVGRRITSVLAIDDLLHEIVRLLKETFGYHLIGISLIEGDELVVRAGAGPPLDDPHFQPPRVKVGQEGITGWVADTGQPLLVPDVSQDPRYISLSDTAETQSELCVPLRTKEAIIGVLNVESDQLNAFDESDLVVLQSLARYAAIAIEEASLMDAEQRRAEQFRVISEVGHQITSILTTDDLLDQIVRLLKETFGYYLVAISLIEGDELIEKAGIGPPFDDPHFHPPRVKVGGEGIIGWVAGTGEPLLVPDVSQEPRYLFVSEIAETRSELCVPLKTKEGVIGVLNVESDQLNAFDESDLMVLQSLARYAAVAIDEARLMDAELRRAEQFRIISEVGRHITSILDVDELLQEIVRLLKETFGYYQITIGLIEGDELVFKAGAKTDWGDAQFCPPPLKVGGEGITAWVADTGEPLLAPDVSQEARYLFLADAAETRSELAVPLKTKEGVIGVLNVESDQLSAFDKSDLVVLQSLANQAAIAIENARLYEDTRSRLAQVTALQETTRAVASTLELNRLLNLIIQQATTLLQADGGIINVVDWENREDEAVAVTGLAGSALGNRAPLEGSLSGWVTLHNQPVISNELQNDSRADLRALSKLVKETKRRIQSGAIAPLTIKDQVMGTLVVLDKQGGRGEFDQTDLGLLVAFANQAAMAIQNARLFDGEQRRAEQFRLISEVGGHITSILAVDELLKEIVRLVKETFGYYLVGIGLVEGDEMVFKTGVGPPFDDSQFQPPRIKIGSKGITAWVAATGEPLLAPDVSQEPRYLLLSASSETLSELAVPLKTTTGVIGVLDVQSDQLDAFDESDLAVLQSLANQAAIAIENARLFDAEQRRAEQFRVISEVGARITSILAVDELLKEIVRLVKETFGSYVVLIGLIEGDEMVLSTGVGPPFDDPQFRPPRVNVGGKGVTAWVATTGEPLLTTDVSQEPRYLLLPGWGEIKSELTVPLKTKTGVIGVLDVQSDQIDAFDESDLVVLQSLANQAAIAIEEARLFDAEQRRAEQFRAISEVGRHITSVLDVEELLDEIVRSVKESLGYYHAAIGLIEGDELVIKTGAGAHWDDPAFQPSRLEVGGQGITAWVASMGEPLLVPDVSEDPRYLLLPYASQIRSELAVPLKTTSGVIGVLDVQSDQLNAFDESDLVVLQALSHQAAVAIENARLYEGSQQAAALEERSRLARDLHDAVTQTLFSASLIGEVVPTLWESDQDEGRQLLGELRQLTRGALAEMRTLLLELRPAALADSRLDDLLHQLAEAVTGRTGVPVTVTVEGRCDLPPDVHVALYRIAQEALNNVVKHAQASQVEVSLSCTVPSPKGLEQEQRPRVDLLVADDGRGFDPSRIPPDRLGLGIIHERAQDIGATVDVESQPGEGSRVMVVWKG